jgi:hypothetical protein
MNKLRDVRLSHRYDPRDFVRFIGMTEQEYWDLENGWRGVGLPTWFRIADVMRVSIDDILPDTALIVNRENGGSI